MNPISEAKALICDGSKWIQGDYAADGDRYCMEGALMHAANTIAKQRGWQTYSDEQYNLYRDMQITVQGVIHRQFPLSKDWSIPRFNDTLGRTHEDVMKVMEEAEEKWERA